MCGRTRWRQWQNHQRYRRAIVPCVAAFIAYEGASIRTAHAWSHSLVRMIADNLYRFVMAVKMLLHMQPHAAALTLLALMLMPAAGVAAGGRPQWRRGCIPASGAGSPEHGHQHELLHGVMAGQQRRHPRRRCVGGSAPDRYWRRGSVARSIPQDPCMPKMNGGAASASPRCALDCIGVRWIAHYMVASATQKALKMRAVSECGVDIELLAVHGWNVCALACSAVLNSMGHAARHEIASMYVACRKLPCVLCGLCAVRVVCYRHCGGRRHSGNRADNVIAAGSPMRSGRGRFERVLTDRAT